MKLFYHEGCLAHGLLEIDKKNFFELSMDEQRRVAKKLLKGGASEDVLYNFIRSICKEQGDEIDYGQCKECGDHCYDYVLTI